MAHRLFDWSGRINSAWREYQVMRISLDCLRNSSDDDVHQLIEAREWTDFSGMEINNADWHLDSTYLIRMYSVFEIAVESFWRQLPGNEDRSAEGDVKLEEVGFVVGVPCGTIEAAQEVRKQRNRVVHRRIERYAGNTAVESASHDLLLYLGRLPGTWN